jgi:hypothetical protein
MAMVAVAPLAAQGTVGMAYFLTVSDENVPQLEEGLKEHLRFHEAQNDTWVWNMYQALGGGQEYAAVSAGHMWADLDNMPIDVAADAADWARTGAPHSESIEVVIWDTWIDVSIPPAPDAPPAPIVQTVEFDFDGSNDGQQAIRAAMKQFHDVVSAAGAPFQYTWNEVVTRDGGPAMFAAIFLQNFGGLDADDPDAMQAMLEGALGRHEAREMMLTFEKHLTVTNVRFWVLRPDLSYTPGM